MHEFYICKTSASHIKLYRTLYETLEHTNKNHRLIERTVLMNLPFFHIIVHMYMYMYGYTFTHLSDKSHGLYSLNLPGRGDVQRPGNQYVNSVLQHHRENVLRGENVAQHSQRSSTNLLHTAS